MTTRTGSRSTAPGTAPANGAALAAFLGAGVGAFAMGFFVILNEAGTFAAPAFYGPAGGVSGRTTLSVVTWLIAWTVLHSRWKDRQMAHGRVQLATFLLVGVGILFTFPPIWGLF